MKLEIITKYGHTYYTDVENFNEKDMEKYKIFIEKIFTFNLYTITSNKAITCIKVSEIEAVNLII